MVQQAELQAAIVTASAAIRHLAFPPTLQGVSNPRFASGNTLNASGIYRTEQIVFELYLVRRDGEAAVNGQLSASYSLFRGENESHHHLQTILYLS